MVARDESDNRTLASHVQYVRGVGPRVAQTLSKLGIATVVDLIHHYPRRYEDRSQLPKLITLRPGQYATVRARLVDVHTRPTAGGKVILKATLSDGTSSVTLVWFNQPWVRNKLLAFNGEIIAYGLVKDGSIGYEISSPEWEFVGEDGDASEAFGRIVPIYPSTEGIGQRQLRRVVQNALDDYLDACVRDPLTPEILRAQMLRPLRWSLRHIHCPDDEEHRAQARQRLVFEEFFYLQLAQQMRRMETRQEPGIAFKVDEPSLWPEIGKLFPFELTAAQVRVIGEILADMCRPQPMNRLLQGDVGSGKTAVAACAMLAAVKSGYQAALMAPTEILAEQHAMSLRRIFEPLGIEVALLLGKLRAKERRNAHDLVLSGKASIVVGTHALIQQDVQFQNLGFVIVDEQHRFGVLQRADLRKKGALSPDVLVMTATPIPRTLTMTIYGDLDVSVLDELPPGRRPIKTYWKMAHERPHVYRNMRSLISEGRQAYFVCPMIEESEKMQTQAAVDLHYRLATLEFPELKVGLLHGQMKPIEKEAVMEQLRRGELNILVSTVVIEVGVDVPNATVMVIEDANRFGLSQLHQLRGRVGRGTEQSYCILIADAKEGDAQARLDTLVATSDGFKIAEEDLRLRGPGEIAGTKQSGNLDLKIADLIQDARMLEVARQAAIDLLEQDPFLRRDSHAAILQRVKELRIDTALIAVS